MHTIRIPEGMSAIFFYDLFKVESLNRDGIVVHICVFFAEKRNRIKLHSNYAVQDMHSFLNEVILCFNTRLC
jgi:hypothetical protein